MANGSEPSPLNPALHLTTAVGSACPVQCPFACAARTFESVRVGSVQESLIKYVQRYPGHLSRNEITGLMWFDQVSFQRSPLPFLCNPTLSGSIRDGKTMRPGLFSADSKILFI